MQRRKPCLSRITCVQFRSVRLSRCCLFRSAPCMAVQLRCVLFRSNRPPFASCAPRLLVRILCFLVRVSAFLVRDNFCDRTFFILNTLINCVHGWISSVRLSAKNVLVHACMYGWVDAVGLVSRQPRKSLTCKFDKQADSQTQAEKQTDRQ